MLEQLTKFIVTRPRLVVILSAFVALSLSLPMAQLQMTSDYRVFFSSENPELVASDRFERTYTSNDTAIIAIKPQSGDVFQKDVLSLLSILTDRGWKLPHVVRVDSPINFQRIEANGDDIIIGDLVSKPIPEDAEELNGLRQTALAQPLIVKRLLSEDATTAGVLLTLRFPGEDHSRHLPEAITAIRDLVSELKTQHPNVQFAVTGMAPLTYAMDEITLRELTLLLPGMLLVLTLVLALLLRSLSAVAATLIVVALSAAGAMGFAGLIGIKVTTVSVVAPIIILTVSVADSIHLISSLLEERRDGKELCGAISESIRVNAEPIFLTSLTTMVGFLSLNFSESPPFRDLGNITAAGVLIAWVLSMTLLPALLVLWGIRKPGRRSRESDWLFRFADFVVNRRKLILIVTAVLAIGSVASVPLNTLDDRFLQWFDESMEPRVDADFVTENLTGPYQIEFSLQSSQTQSVTDPKYLQDVEAFSDWLSAQPGVSHVYSLPDVMKRLNQAMNAGDPSFFVLPAEPDLAAQYLLLYEFSLPYGLDLNTQINLNKSASRLTVTTLGISSAETRDLKRRAEDWVASNAAHISPTEGTGTSVMFAFVSKRTIDSMLAGTAFAILLIGLTILVALKSFKIGLMSILPNILPVTVTFGVWGLLVGEIGIIGSTIAASTLGLVVDDTVHFLSKYHRARQEHGLSTHDGIRFAFEHVGRAMITTTLVLAAGFFVLTYSDFLLNWQMGVLTIMTIFSALILDFFLLPALLMLIDREKTCDCSTCRSSAWGKPTITRDYA
jgi:predicted RND superfamily exporter protein